MRKGGESMDSIIETPIGAIRIREEQGYITELYTTARTCASRTPLAEKAEQQLAEYFSGKRTEFDLPCRPKGTAFQEKVWAALRQIPYAETRSYKDIACAIGSPKACRAVGGAIHRNPILILIPCHRVIGADGSMTGFGAGIPLKETLLTLERNSKPC